MRDGGFISAHDYHLGRTIAEVMCGGDVDAGTPVDDDWMMRLERKAFTGLLDHPKTQERIMGHVADRQAGAQLTPGLCGWIHHRMLTQTDSKDEP
jgi:hypothetical protein